MHSSSRFLIALALSATALLGCSDNDNDSLFAPEAAPVSVDPFADNGAFLSVLPPGSADANDGNINSDPNSTDQLAMYENLAFSENYPTPGQLNDEDLTPGYFKDAAFLAESVFDSPQRVSDGTLTARIARDDFGVPHIFGDTRSDVMFGTGYATATDRMFLIDVVRHVGRGRMSDFVGPAAGNYSSDRELGQFGGYSEQEMQDQLDQVAVRFGVDGEQAQQDMLDFVNGINQYIDDVQNGAAGAEAIPIEYAGLSLELRKFTGRDVLAVAALVQSTFASGGGGEYRQARLVNGLGALFPGEPEQACQLWRDLRQANDPERPNTIDTAFETQSPPIIDEDACPLTPEFSDQFPGAVLFDSNSLEELELLIIEDCVEPGMAMGADIECPNFREDVVEDSVTIASASPTLLEIILGDSPLLAVLENIKTASNQKQIVASVPHRSLTSYSATQLQAGRERAIATLAGLRLALSADSFPTMASNAILVNADQTASGNPIAVFGPQTGYFSPQILMEFSQQGGDINNRGVAFAGLPYVIIGRGIDHAWSATSAGDDITDIRVLRLCEPGGTAATRASTSYLYNGVCTPMLRRSDEWTAETNVTTPGMANQKVTRDILRAPDYGPVFATATVSGAPVALAIQRSTFFGEPDSVATFVATSRNEVINPDTFFDVFNKLTGTFSWFYIDANNIAYFNSGLLPNRAAGIHPDLPQWGDGEFDWQQSGTGRLNPDFSFDNFLPLEAHPRAVNPPTGYFVNWNNAQAPGFYAHDTQVGYGALYRSLLLEKRLQALRAEPGNPLLTRANMVEIMIDAGTSDLRGQEILPQVFAILSDVSDLDAFEQQTLQVLRDWVRNGPRELGAMRRDRSGPGFDTPALQYEDRDAVAFMDAWWGNMIVALLPQIVAVENAGVMVGGRHNQPGPVGSAFQSGYYGYMRRVLDMALGESTATYRQLKCAGSSELEDCRAAVVASLQQTIAELGTDMQQWAGSLEQDDAINHTAFGLADPPNIHWQNRPTWQQVVQPTQDVL
ncbi:MAG: penicillin acylase family protein [Pseudomonadales bacterium]